MIVESIRHEIFLIYLLDELLEAALDSVGRFSAALDVQSLMPPGKIEGLLGANLSVRQVDLVAHDHLNNVHFIAISIQFLQPRFQFKECVSVRNIEDQNSSLAIPVVARS